MSTQSIARTTPRIRAALGTVMIAIGVLVAVAVAIIFLAAGSANNSGAASRSSWSASQAATSSTPQTRYLGPRQVNELGAIPTANTGNPGPQYSCLGPAAQRCLR